MSSLLEAQYAYEYEDDDGSSVNIMKGERFLLINKSTEDWWKVQRVETKMLSSPTVKNILYVPAAYMQEILSSGSKLSVGGQDGTDGPQGIPANHDYMNLNAFRNMIGVNSESQVVNGPPETNGNEDSNTSNGARYENFASVTNSFGTGTPISDIAGRKSPGSPNPVVENGDKSPSSSPKVPAGILQPPGSFQSINSRQERSSSSSYGISDGSDLDMLEKQDKAMLSKSFDGQEHIYDQAGMMLRAETMPTNTTNMNRKSWTLPAGGLPTEWRKVTDNSSGRSYYFNERTNESAWKPPRLSAYFEQRSDEEDDENDDTFESDSDAPPGWILELDEDTNETIYINSVTQERWKSCRDESGQVYYYQMDGDGTAWELPSVEVHFRSLRRRSLDDILEEKRYSQASLFNRNSKCKSVMIDTNNSLQHPPPALPPGASSPVGISKGNHRRSHSALAYESLGASTPDLHTAPLTILEGKKVNIVEREGMLFRRKVAEGGKSIKRGNWQQCYVVKYGSTLVFYKDQKSAAPRAGFPNGKPESSLDLRGAILEHVPKDKSRGKKHVFQVRSYGGGTIIQLFADNVQSMGRWITCIQTTIKRLEEEEPLPLADAESVESGLDSADSGGSPGTPTSTLPRQPSPPTPSTLAPPSSKNRGQTGSGEKGFRGFSRRLSKRGQLGSEKDEDKEKTKIKDKLKKFMARRPSYSELEKKGIIKDQVFGCNIARLCAREGTKIPKFVTMCINIIEDKGLDSDGIYRVCGNVSMVQKLRILIDHEETIHFGEHQWDDVHIFTGALKLYFRELPEPLFPYHLFDQFVEAIRKPTRQEKLRCCKQLVPKLPPPNHDTIVLLFKHLKRVIERSSKNRMQSQNVSIVFGPTLLRPENETSNMALNMVYQNQIVDFMLQEFENIF